MPLNFDSTVELPPLFDLNDNQVASPAAGAGGGGPPTDGAGGGPPAGGAGGQVAQATPVRPTPIGVTAMPPVVGAGIELAKIVLFIAAGSIGLLTIYLVSMDLWIGRDVHKAYQEVLNPSRIGAEFYTLGRLEEFSNDLAAARKDPNLQLSAESVQNAESILKTITVLPSVTTAQKTDLGKCIPVPTATTTRNENLDRCIQIIESIRQAALEAAAGVTNAQVAGESASRINEHRQNLHTFWIQAAQLILLNLLLPLLTALFGYIFGTQQGRSSSS